MLNVWVNLELFDAGRTKQNIQRQIASIASQEVVALIDADVLELAAVVSAMARIEYDNIRGHRKVQQNILSAVQLAALD